MAGQGNQCLKRRMCLRAQPTADKVEEERDDDDNGDGDGDGDGIGVDRNL